MTTHDRRDAREPARAGVVHLEGRLIGEAGAPRRGAPALLLHPWVEVFGHGDDVYLLRSGDERHVVIRAPEAEDRALLDHLAAGGTVATDDARAGRLEPLRRGGFVIERATSGDDAGLERFERQLPYLAAFAEPADAMRRLRASRVCILGCGGLGTWTLAALACTGIGAFTLVDDDAVDLSNLNRQVLYTAGDLGARKVDRAAAWVARFDPEVVVDTWAARVESVADVRRAIAGADAVVVAADWPPYQLARWVNAACLDAELPFVTAAQQPPILRVGPTYMPGGGACFACHERRLAEAFPLYDALAEHRRAHITPATTLGPASGIVGTLLAQELLHLLVGPPAPLATRDRAVILDMRTLDTRVEEIFRHPDCEICG